MTELEALLRVEDMAYDARNGLARRSYHHDLDAEALDIFAKVIAKTQLQVYHESRPFIDRIMHPDAEDKGIGPYL